jgi:hypothetical protein
MNKTLVLYNKISKISKIFKIIKPYKNYFIIVFSYIGLRILYNKYMPIIIIKILTLIMIYS